MKKDLAVLFIFLFISGCTSPADITGNPDVSGNLPVTGNPDVSGNFPLTSNPPVTGNPSVVPIADFTKATDLITQKCAYCHSANPNPASGYRSPPRGIIFDSVAEINLRAIQIKNVVSSGAMPRRPMTMTAAERSTIVQWANNQ